MAWDFGYGKPFTEETEEMLLKALEPDFVDGLSLLGGEPFEPENQRVLLPFLKKVRERFPKKISGAIPVIFSIKSFSVRAGRDVSVRMSC